MSNLAIAQCQPSPFPVSYLPSNRESSLSTSLPHSFLTATLLSLTTAFTVPAYQVIDFHITPGQIPVISDKFGEVIFAYQIRHASHSAWVERVLQLCALGDEDVALKEISLATTNFKSSGEFQLLSNDLAHLMSKKLPDIVFIGLLRNTYSVRKHIQDWDTFLGQTEGILISHDRNHRALLRGLKSYL